MRAPGARSCQGGAAALFVGLVEVSGEWWVDEIRFVP